MRTDALPRSSLFALTFVSAVSWLAVVPGRSGAG